MRTSVTLRAPAAEGSRRRSRRRWCRLLLLLELARRHARLRGLLQEILEGLLGRLDRLLRVGDLVDDVLLVRLQAQDLVGVGGLEVLPQERLRLGLQVLDLGLRRRDVVAE